MNLLDRETYWMLILGFFLIEALFVFLLLSTSYSLGVIATREQAQENSMNLQVASVKHVRDSTPPSSEITKAYYGHLMRSTLTACQLPYTQDTVNLLLGTAAVESDFFKTRVQLDGGPALGYFQCEPSTRADIIKHYLRYEKELKDNIESYLGAVEMSDEAFLMDVPMQIIFAYLHYDRYGHKPTTISGYATVWKQCYNTYLGRGEISHFIDRYNKYIGR